MHRILNRSSVASLLCALSIATLSQFALAADSPAQAQFILGNNAVDAKQYSEAIGYFSKAIEIDPQYWKAYANRGAARYNAGDPQGGLADVKIAIPHFPDNQSLKNIVGMCENQINNNANMAAKREAARQMLLNAQLGGDITDPGFQILMAARRAKGLNPITGMPMNGGIGAGAATVQNAAQNKVFADPNATTSGAVTSKLESMAKGVHVTPEEPGKTSAMKGSSTAAVEQTPSNPMQDSLAARVANLPPPNLDGASTDSTASTGGFVAVTESSSFATSPTTTAGMTLTSAAPSSLVRPLSAAPQHQPTAADSPRHSAVNYVRDPKTGMTAQDYYARACEKDKAGDYQGAIKDYDEAIKLNPNHGPAYANRGSTRFNSGDRKGALKDFNMAVGLMPENNELRALRDRVAGMQ